MKKDFLEEFVNEATKEIEAKIALEKRKKHFHKPLNCFKKTE